jgi:hypothetical protein
MTRENSVERLLARVDEIVDFTPYFPNTIVVVPHSDFRGVVANALIDAYTKAGQYLKWARIGTVGNYDFLTQIFTVSTNALRGRTVDTLYMPPPDGLTKNQLHHYNEMMNSMYPVISSMRFSRLYVY